jgi:hypothetical protein
MLKEIPLLRAPENKRTGMEIKPKVKCPDQTDDAIVPPRSQDALCHPEEAESLAQRETPDEGPVYFWPATPACPTA